MQRPSLSDGHWSSLVRFLIKEIDTFPIDKQLDGNNLEEVCFVDWIAGARVVRDLDLAKADELAVWSFIGDISGNASIFYPACLALLKQALLEPEKRWEEEWRLTCAVGYVNPGFDHESRWRTLMTSGLFLLLLKVEHVPDVADGLYEALLDIVSGVARS